MTDNDYSITAMSRDDFEQFWPVFRDIVDAQETYAFPVGMTLEEGYHLWCEYPQQTFALKIDDSVAGSYYIKPNAAGPGSHVCNCGYMVDPHFRGQGIARTLCEHSQQVAEDLGFHAMQFNSVVSTNEAAVHLWEKMGYNIIGTVPQAYQHKSRGLVDAYVMYKKLS